MRITTFLLLSLLLTAFACTSKKAESNDQSKTSSEPASIKVDPSTAATLSGVVKFDGVPPKPHKIDMSQDPACGKQPVFDESIVVNHGDIANTFVYVKSHNSSGGL